MLIRVNSILVRILKKKKNRKNTVESFATFATQVEVATKLDLLSEIEYFITYPWHNRYWLWIWFQKFVYWYCMQYWRVKLSMSHSIICLKPIRSSKLLTTLCDSHVNILYLCSKQTYSICLAFFGCVLLLVASQVILLLESLSF